MKKNFSLAMVIMILALTAISASAEETNTTDFIKIATELNGNISALNQKILFQEEGTAEYSLRNIQPNINPAGGVFIDGDKIFIGFETTEEKEKGFLVVDKKGAANFKVTLTNTTGGNDFKIPKIIDGGGDYFFMLLTYVKFPEFKGFVTAKKPKKADEQFQAIKTDIWGKITADNPNGPSAICTFDGKLFITTEMKGAGKNKIIVFDSKSLEFLRQFEITTSVKITNIAANSNSVFVLDSEGKVSAFDFAGNLQNNFIFASSCSFYKSSPFLSDFFFKNGLIYVVDSNNGIAIFKPNGEFISLGEKMDLGLQFPENIFVSDDAVYITDPGRIISFSPWATANRDLSLNFCVNYAGAFYDAKLNFAPQTNDPKGFYWQLDPTSFQPVKNEIACFSVEAGYSIPIKTTYQGTNYIFNLKMDNMLERLWKMDTTTFKKNE